MAAPTPATPHANHQHHHRPPPSAAAKFTETELEAAVNLVLLSESSSGGGGSGSGTGTGGFEEEEGGVTVLRGGRNMNRPSCSSSSSSVPSVNTRNLGPIEKDDSIDEELTGPWARTQRYRSIADLYKCTAPIDGVEKQKNKRRKKKVDEDSSSSLRKSKSRM